MVEGSSGVGEQRRCWRRGCREKVTLLPDMQGGGGGRPSSEFSPAVNSGEALELEEAA